MAGKIKGLTVVIDGDTTKLSSAMRSARKESNSLKSELKGVSGLLKFDPTNTALIAQKQGLYSAAIAQTQERMRMLRAAEEQYHAQVGPHTQAEEAEFRNLQREIASTEQRYRQLRQDSVEFGTAASAQTLAASAKMAEYGVALEAAGKKMLVLTSGVAYIGYKGVQTSMEFDTAMSQVAATMGMGADEVANGSESFEKLTDIAREMGATTKFTATQAAEGLNYLALAGYDAEASVAALPTVLNLAAAGNMDLATASDLVTDALSALGFSSEQLASDQSILTSYADEMAKTASSANTSVQQLGEATLISAGTARTYGISLEEINTALGVLANNGLKSAEGGTALRNAILNLYAASSAAQPMLDELGVSTKDSEGNLKSLEDVLTQLNGALSGMTQADRAEAIATIFDKRVIAPAVALLNSTGSEVMSLGDALKAAGIDAEKYGTSIGELQDKYRQMGEGADFAAQLTADFGLSQDDAAALADSVALSLGDSSTAFGDLKAKVEDAGGACQTMADTQLGNLEGSVTLLKSAVDGALQTIGGELSPTIREAAGALTEAVTVFNNLDEGQKQAIIRTALLAAAIGPVVTIAGKLTTGMGKLISAYASAKTTLDLWSQGLTKSALAQQAAGTAMEATTKKAKAQQIALQGAANAARLMAGAFAALTAIEVISWIDGTSARLSQAGEKLESAASSVRSFGTMVAESTSRAGDMDAALTESGSTVGKLEATIQEKEASITSIISTALAEQRSLREEDLKSIEAYNAQIEQLESEKVQAYQSGMQGIADSAAAEGEVTTERAAELIATANDYYASGLSDLDSYHSKRLQTLAQQHGVEGSLTSEQYAAAIQEENAYYERSRSSLEAQLDATAAAVAEKASATAAGFTAEQQAAMEQVSALSEKMSGMLSFDVFGQTVYVGESTSKVRGYAAELEEALVSVANSTSAAFLGLQLTVADSGGQITEENAAMVDELLSQFENLPPGMEEAGNTAMRSLASGLDEQLGIDVANSAASQIAAAFRAKIPEAGAAGSQTGSSYASGVDSQSGKARDAGSELAEGASDGAKSTDGASAGKNFATGFIDKIGSMVSGAFDAGFNFVKNALTGANKAQDAHSPSRAMAKSADWFAQGFLNNLASYEADAYDAGYSFMASSVEGAASAQGSKLSLAVAANEQRAYGEARAASAQMRLEPGSMQRASGGDSASAALDAGWNSGTTNIYIDGAKVNSDEAIAGRFYELMTELARKGMM